MESDAASSDNDECCASGAPDALAAPDLAGLAGPSEAGPSGAYGRGRKPSVSIDEIFAVNKPPSKRKTPPPPTGAKPRRRPTAAAPPAPSAKAQAISDAVQARDHSVPTDLLDDRVVCDPDENYSENERALTQFLRLHPMLSLDATSERMLSIVGSMIEDYSVPSKELEVVSRAHDDLFLRAPRASMGERPCVNADKCVCRWVAIFRHGENTEKAFVCREFLLPSQNELFLKDGTLPKTAGKCLMCMRYFTNYVYTLARNSPTFCPKSSIQLQVFANKIHVESAGDTAMTSTAEVGTANGYHASKMLFVDEKWAETASSRSTISTMLWRPCVRFNCSDYEFTKDGDGLPMAVQKNMGVESSHFGPPP